MDVDGIVEGKEATKKDEESKQEQGKGIFISASADAGVTEKNLKSVSGVGEAISAQDRDMSTTAQAQIDSGNITADSSIPPAEMQEPKSEEETPITIAVDTEGHGLEKIHNVVQDHDNMPMKEVSDKDVAHDDDIKEDGGLEENRGLQEVDDTMKNKNEMTRRKVIMDSMKFIQGLVKQDGQHPIGADGGGFNNLEDLSRNMSSRKLLASKYSTGGDELGNNVANQVFHNDGIVHTNTNLMLMTEVRKGLQSSGAMLSVKNKLSRKLEACGWKDELRASCRKVAKHRNFSNVTIDEIIREVSPLAYASLPLSSRLEAMRDIKKQITKL